MLDEIIDVFPVLTGINRVPPWRTKAAQEEKRRKAQIRKSPLLADQFLIAFMEAEKDSDTERALITDDALLLAEELLKVNKLGGDGGIMAKSLLRTLVADGFFYFRDGKRSIFIRWQGIERHRELIDILKSGD